MKIQIELELLDYDARVLRSMASLGRYCDAVLRVCEGLGSEPIDVSVSEDAELVESTTKMIKPALISLHLQLREKLVSAGITPLWKQ